jgi:hypothetical protein
MGDQRQEDRPIGGFGLCVGVGEVGSMGVADDFEWLSQCELASVRVRSGACR